MRVRTTLGLSAIVVLSVFVGLAAAGAGGSGTKSFTELSGAEEADASGNVGVGDPDGAGTALLRLNQGTRRICWTISWEDIAAPTASHIHEAPAGVAGDIVVPLDPVASGCTSAPRALIKDIRQNPSDYYVNVHNEEFPAGAIRGQLGD